MGTKSLVGAVVAALSLWSGVWTLAGLRPKTVALQAPERAAPQTDARNVALESAHETRASAFEPEAPVPSVAPAQVAVAVAASSVTTLTPREIAHLVAELRDDDVSHNALHAVAELREAGPEVLQALEDALRSNDWQQRQLAALLLADRSDVPPTQLLADVLVEGLQQREWPDGLPEESDPYPQIALYTGFDIHEHAREALSRSPSLCALAEQDTARLLESDSLLTRFAAARVLASQRSGFARETVLAILIEHLEQNQIEGDARIALPAIAGFGSAALPVLERSWPGRDEQQRALLGHLIWACAPDHAWAHELDPAAFHALGFSRWNPLPLEERDRGR